MSVLHGSSGNGSCGEMAWSDTFLKVLKDSDVRLGVGMAGVLD